MGVESRAPTLAWAAPPTQAAQASYQLQVTELPSGMQLCDSGVVPGGVQSATVCGALKPASSYSVRVRTTDGGGGGGNATSDWSADCRFVTGMWDAWAPSAAPVWHANATAGFVLLRWEGAVVDADSSLSSAVAYVTANPQGSVNGESENAKLLAAYRLYVGGALVGMGPGRQGRCGPVCPVGGDPGACTCTREHVYDTYDVTTLVAAATTGGSPLTLALQSYNQPPNPARPAANATSGVLMQLVLTFANGSTSSVFTGPDAGWSAYNADGYYLPSCCTSDVGAY
jgi:hypothetical protein